MAACLQISKGDALHYLTGLSEAVQRFSLAMMLNRTTPLLV